MCGIAGYVSRDRGKLLPNILASMEHRGRDGTAMLSHGPIHIGMNRLAINDLGHNPFPMLYKHYQLIFNGEIYNYEVLKRELSSWGVRFRTTCDAEVILPLFDRYGTHALTLLEGMFALCIVDTRSNSIILARDKIGEKPLYYSQSDQVFVFSSELRALVQSGLTSKKLHAAPLGEYLMQGFISRATTLVKNVYRILPGQYLLFSANTRSVAVQTYWRLPLSTRISGVENESSPVDRLEELLKSAVHSRLLADVPVGCFLSGGVDSSLVALFASEQISRLKTYSVSFPSEKEFDESKYALQVSKQIGTKHTEVSCTAGNVAGLVKRIGSLIDEPISDPAVLPTFLMAHEARKTVKVVLTGEGADELFAGYNRYFREIIIEAIRLRVPLPTWMESVRSVLFPNSFRKLFVPFLERYQAQSIWTSQDVSHLLHEDIFSRLSFPIPPIARVEMLTAMQHADIGGYLASQLLTKVDRMTMVNNLEARAPYLDTALIKFALGLSRQNKIRWFQNKYILRLVAARHFPASIALRKKHGFSVPLNEWFRKELKKEVQVSIDQLSQYHQLFNISFYQSIVAEHLERRRDNSDKIWSLMTLSSWLTHLHLSV